MARWGIAVEGPLVSWADVFDAGSGDDIDVVLDIGFGAGEALVELAEIAPVRVRRRHRCAHPRHRRRARGHRVRGLRNVRVVDGDVLDFIGRIPDGSLSAIRVFFPDPWPKQRQRGRRLIRPDVVAQLVPRAAPRAVHLQLATDVADYAAQMQSVCDAHPALRGGVIARPSWRPATRFEQRAIDEGRSPVDLLYIAVGQFAQRFVERVEVVVEVPLGHRQAQVEAAPRRGVDPSVQQGEEQRLLQRRVPVQQVLAVGAVVAPARARRSSSRTR